MKMIALSSEELIAKEAKYHASCYSDYTTNHTSGAQHWRDGLLISHQSDMVGS